jgi:hypothetical protein
MRHLRDELGIGDRRRVDRHLVSAAAQEMGGVIQAANAAAHRHRHEHVAGGRLYDFA